MKKNFGRMAVLSALSLALVACGGGASSAADSTATSDAASVASADATSAATSAASADATSTTSTTQTAPAATSIIGTWKLAAMEQSGILMGGDMRAVLQMTGEVDEKDLSGDLMTITFAEGGKGTLTMLSESNDITWEETTTGAKVTPVASDSNPNPDSIDVTLEGNAVSFSMNGNKAYFTADGTYDGVKPYDIAAAKNVTSESELIGEWKLSGLNMMGLTMQGDPQTLIDQMGLEGASLSFSAGGKCVAFDTETTYSVDANGATILDEDNNLKVPVKMLDGQIVLDMSASLGSDLAMVFVKA